MYDITVRVQKERDTLLLALEENLTGLKNRRGCERFVATLASQKKAAYIATMMLDLDGFKDVNDTHGHAAGDEVLCTIARRLKKVARGGQDVIRRIGGDELLVILALEQINPDVLAGIAEQIVEICARPIELPSRSTVRIGGSVGVSYAGVNDIEFDALLQQADEAMYQVKENGKNGYAFYNPELRRA
jgi:diguanylate cyclase (GGDEF)-like protein